jgi:4-amino-4-deoxy-L-arabinose transferase-like glycosyltransferase
MQFYPYLPLLLLLLTVKAFAVLLYIILGPVGLGPDEAQYWTWSQQLAFGYYSKPPAIAWQIAAGTAVLGNSELAVRVGAVGVGTLIPIALYFLARNCQLLPRTCFWSAVVFALSPLGFAATFLAITDGGMLLFWIVAASLACGSFAQQRKLPYDAIGAAILCGALFKWPIYMLWPFIAMGAAFQGSLDLKRLLRGVALSLLGLLPSLIWNMQSDWPTFRHVLATIDNGQQSIASPQLAAAGNFPDFVGAQIALLSPLFFALLLCSWVRIVKEWRTVNGAIRWCAVVSVLLLGGYSALALSKKIQGNWCDFAYPTAIILLCWYASERLASGKRWLLAGSALSLTMVVALLGAVPMTLSDPKLYKRNPFKHNVGGRQLPEVLTAAGYKPSDHFLMSDRYQTCSLLSFYSPGQQRAYFLNLQGIRKNQFSYWPTVAEEHKKVGFFAVIENGPLANSQSEALIAQYRSQLGEYFAKVESLGGFALLEAKGQPLKIAYLFRCEGFAGKLPPDSSLY